MSSGDVRFRPGDVIAELALSLTQGFGAGLGWWVSGLLFQLNGSFVASPSPHAAFADLASFWVVASHPRVPGHLSNSAWGEKSPP